MKINKTEILCTIGPASLNEQVISRLEALGVGIFRINLSHTKAEELEAIIKQIQSITDVPICLDTEGAQIRTGDLLKTELNCLRAALFVVTDKKQAVARRDLTSIPAKL